MRSTRARDGAFHAPARRCTARVRGFDVPEGWGAA
jgi:hypothetical protein